MQKLNCALECTLPMAKNLVKIRFMKSKFLTKEFNGVTKIITVNKLPFRGKLFTAQIVKANFLNIYSI